MAKDYIGFTLDLRKLVSVLAQDPTCRAQIAAGLQCPAEPLTSQLGAANMGTQEEPIWCSVFPATVHGKQSGEEGLFYRNNSFNGPGDRVQMRLKQQTQQQTQPAQQQYQVAVTASQAMPQGAGAATQAAAVQELQTKNPELFSQLLAALGAQDGQLNATVQSQPAPALQQEKSAPHIPADIAAIINNAS